jgi:NADH dehydrogenase
MKQNIVIVGGGAGGLELACKLGRKLGPDSVTLVDSRLTHIWKPSLHEVAAGTLDVHAEGLSYQMLAHDNGFTFVYGAMSALNKGNKTIQVDAVLTDKEIVLIPERVIAFSDLVIAVGSVSNYFNVPGASTNTIALNAPEDAEAFRNKMMRHLHYANGPMRRDTAEDAGVDIVIIGGGATGVELAAELSEARNEFAAYGVHNLDAKKSLRLTILEGSPRVLAPLPERVSEAADKLLKLRDVTVKTGCRVVDITSTLVTDSTGQTYKADITVWAAGIKAPDFLATLGLPTARSGALIVDGKLRVDEAYHIYALGDCASFTDKDGKMAPPRAQTAHQQADYLYDRFMAFANGRPASVKDYQYKDYGSLVSIGHSTSVGNLMGSLAGRWFIEGWFARIMYVSLHLLHHRAILGTIRTGILALARFLIKRTAPLVKLH